MRILRGLGSRLLSCGCLVGRYETYSGATIWMVDAVALGCDVPTHRINGLIAPAEPAPMDVPAMPNHP